MTAPHIAEIAPFAYVYKHGGYWADIDWNHAAQTLFCEWKYRLFKVGTYRGKQLTLDKFFWDVRYEEEIHDCVFAYVEDRSDLIVPYFFWSRPENPIFIRAVNIAVVSLFYSDTIYFTAL